MNEEKNSNIFTRKANSKLLYLSKFKEQNELRLKKISNDRSKTEIYTNNNNNQSDYNVNTKFKTFMVNSDSPIHTIKEIEPNSTTKQIDLDKFAIKIQCFIRVYISKCRIRKIKKNKLAAVYDLIKETAQMTNESLNTQAISNDNVTSSTDINRIIKVQSLIRMSNERRQYLSLLDSKKVIDNSINEIENNELEYRHDNNSNEELSIKRNSITNINTTSVIKSDDTISPLSSNTISNRLSSSLTSSSQDKSKTVNIITSLPINNHSSTNMITNLSPGNELPRGNSHGILKSPRYSDVMKSPALSTHLSTNTYSNLPINTLTIKPIDTNNMNTGIITSISPIFRKYFNYSPSNISAISSLTISPKLASNDIVVDNINVVDGTEKTNVNNDKVISPIDSKVDNNLSIETIEPIEQTNNSSCFYCFRKRKNKYIYIDSSTSSKKDISTNSDNNKNIVSNSSNNFITLSDIKGMVSHHSNDKENSASYRSDSFKSKRDRLDSLVDHRKLLQHEHIDKKANKKSAIHPESHTNNILDKPIDSSKSYKLKSSNLDSQVKLKKSVFQTSNRDSKLESKVDDEIVNLTDCIICIKGIDISTNVSLSENWYMEISINYLSNNQMLTETIKSKTFDVLNFQTFLSVNKYIYLLDVSRYIDIHINVYIFEKNSYVISNHSIINFKNNIINLLGGRIYNKLTSKSKYNSYNMSVLTTFIPIVIPTTSFLNSYLYDNATVNQSNAFFTGCNSLIDYSKLKKASHSIVGFNKSLCIGILNSTVLLAIMDSNQQLQLLECNQLGECYGNILNDSIDLSTHTISLILISFSLTILCTTSGYLLSFQSVNSYSKLAYYRWKELQRLQIHSQSISYGCIISYNSFSFVITVDYQSNLCITCYDNNNEYFNHSSFIDVLNLLAMQLIDSNVGSKINDQISSISSINTTIYLSTIRGFLYHCELRNVFNQILASNNSQNPEYIQLINRLTIYPNNRITCINLTSCLKRNQVSIASESIEENHTLFIGGDDANPIVSTYSCFVDKGCYNYLPIQILTGHNRSISQIMCDYTNRYIFTCSQLDKYILIYNGLSYTIEYKIDLIDVIDPVISIGLDCMYVTSKQSSYLDIWTVNNNNIKDNDKGVNSTTNSIVANVISSIRRKSWCYNITTSQFSQSTCNEKSLTNISNNQFTNNDINKYIDLWNSDNYTIHKSVDRKPKLLSTTNRTKDRREKERKICELTNAMESDLYYINRIDRYIDNYTMKQRDDYDNSKNNVSNNEIKNNNNIESIDLTNTLYTTSTSSSMTFNSSNKHTTNNLFNINVDQLLYDSESDSDVVSKSESIVENEIIEHFGSQIGSNNGSYSKIDVNHFHYKKFIHDLKYDD